MKQAIMMMVWVIIGMMPLQQASAQSTEMAQLILDIEKLAQFKKILQDMKDAYEILSKGYNSVRDIAQGNFSIHKVFLDGLLEVSPAVKKYHRIVDIVDCQLQLVKEYKAAFKRTKASKLLNAGELDYLERVYRQLFDESVGNLGDLTTVITAKQLRMSDEERLHAIDVIYEDMANKLTFLRHFNNETSVLLVQRSKESADVKGLQGIIK